LKEADCIPALFVTLLHKMFSLITFKHMKCDYCIASIATPRNVL